MTFGLSFFIPIIVLKIPRKTYFGAESNICKYGCLHKTRKSIKQSGFRRKQYKSNTFFIIFAPKLLSMTLQKWIESRAIHGFPTFSVEDVRAADLCSSEQILQNELSRLCSNKTIASVYINDNTNKWWENISINEKNFMHIHCMRLQSFALRSARALHRRLSDGRWMGAQRRQCVAFGEEKPQWPEPCVWA